MLFFFHSTKYRCPLSADFPNLFEVMNDDCIDFPMYIYTTNMVDSLLFIILQMFLQLISKAVSGHLSQLALRALVSQLFPFIFFTRLNYSRTIANTSFF